MYAVIDLSITKQCGFEGIQKTGLQIICSFLKEHPHQPATVSRVLTIRVISSASCTVFSGIAILIKMTLGLGLAATGKSERLKLPCKDPRPRPPLPCQDIL